MNVLAVRFARLGDVILLLPALGRLKASFPESRITFLTGHRCAPVAEMCSVIDEVISVDRVAMRDGSIIEAIGAIARLAGNVRRRKFDLVIDFHGFRETNLLTWFSGAPRRLGLKRFDQSFLPFCFNLPPAIEDKGLHVSEMFGRVVEQLGCTERSASALVIPSAARKWLQAQMPNGPGVVLYIDAPVPERIWPPERFAAVADYVIERLDASVAVISGPDGDSLIRRVQAAARNAGRLHAFSGLSIPQVAAAIESARLLISNDTGPMHLGPALGVPTLGLFSVGLPEHFRPTGVNDCFLRGNPIDKVALEDVLTAVQKMWGYCG